jgi:hypothetical protein
MKLIILIVLILNGSLNELRNCFFESSKNKAAAEKIISITEKNYSQPVLKGYRGAAFTILSEKENNPFTKLKKFNLGKDLLEEAIQQDSAIFDLRFLRFSIQQESPGFLGYKSNLNTDKIFIINNLTNINDLTYKNKVITYLRESKLLTQAEKKKLK